MRNLQLFRGSKMLIHQLIDNHPEENMAFYDKQRQITYGQLRDKVRLYRNYYYQQGVRADENVGLFSRNSAEFIISYMAITELGAIVVPFNFQLVAREVSYIVQDAGIRVLITQQPQQLELERFGYDQPVKQLILSDIEEVLATSQIPEAVLPAHSDDENVCMIIYTSGTTGHPKGAMLTHRNLIENAKGFLEVIPMQATDNALCILPMYHIFAWTCIVLASLFRGGIITIMDAFIVREVLAVIRSRQVTIMCGTPSMYKLLTEGGSADDFATMRIPISGGASLPQEILQQFTLKTGKNIVEGYGLSEASPVVTMNRPHATKPLSIGPALPGIEVKIIDPEQGHTLPAGEIGELVLRGPNVMRGYYKLPEATAAALRDGWLHTGDMAYRDEQGYYFIVDRIKDLIIIGGENIYPREIEELLYAYPAISEAAVVAVPDELRGDVARAYIVLKTGEKLNKKSLRRYLQENLAAYKIPKDFIVITELPKNPTGKILKRVLREQALQK